MLPHEFRVLASLLRLYGVAVAAAGPLEGATDAVAAGPGDAVGAAVMAGGGDCGASVEGKCTMGLPLSVPPCGCCFNADRRGLDATVDGITGADDEIVAVSLRDIGEPAAEDMREEEFDTIIATLPLRRPRLLTTRKLPPEGRTA